ncbi:MAG: ABC-F family ATP-binding cassette domain-containing protein [Bacteroidia bacterium]
MIALNDIGFEFGGRFLYRNANWHIKPNERIGLIGLNGTGKSTLLRIINGEFSLTEGSISKPKDLTIGFLNQDQLSFSSNSPIIDVAMGAFERALQLEKEIEDIIAKLETDHSDEILNALSEKQEEFEQLDGYNIRHKCEKVLEGLGFSTAQLSQPYNHFSGGWRMRVMLAKILLQQPNLLMLDEPTNHLDLPSIIWLEEYLKGYNGTVIVVSHDRYFLNRMVNKIVEVSMQKITEYPGNYSFYLEARQERVELQQRAFANQQQYIKQQEQLINRFKAKASKASMAQSRIKMLDRLEKVEAPEDDNRQINIRFKIAQQPGRNVAELHKITKEYPGVPIVKNTEARIERGDKIALIGANGKGKSTMLRLLAQTEMPDEGEVQIGYNVKTAFYAQHQLESLNLNNEILQELQQFGSDSTETELRTLLGCFLFEGDEVFKKIKVLSGGEKARVALAKTLLAEANFLLLDEPTNHLDMRSINILIQALQQYTGTFIVVSHDRYFVSEIANKIWYIEDGLIKEYPGNYEEYNYWLSKLEQTKAEIKTEKTKQTQKLHKHDDLKDKKTNNNYIQQLRKKFEDFEQKIEYTKSKINEIENAFTLPENINDSAKLKDLKNEYDAEKKALVFMEKEYEALFIELMELESN